MAMASLCKHLPLCLAMNFKCPWALTQETTVCILYLVTASLVPRLSALNCVFAEGLGTRLSRSNIHDSQCV